MGFCGTDPRQRIANGIAYPHIEFAVVEINLCRVRDHLAFARMPGQRRTIQNWLEAS